jgi:hypothetical protein
MAFAGSVLLASWACGEDPPPARNGGEAVELPEPSGPPVVQQARPEDAAARSGPRWEQGDGAMLRLVNPNGSVRMIVSCIAKPARLAVTVPSFSPIGSEDRFAFGLGAEPITLVADPTLQKPGAGVTGEAPMPSNLARLFGAAREISALYGTQRIGPHGSPPRDLVATFASACARIG